jgi:hypothetical protein
MNHWMVVGVLAALATVGASFQDPAKTDDAKDLLKKGLETSAAAGGFTFTGSVSQDSPFAGAAMAVGAPMLAVGPEGKCSGTLGADGVSHVRLEKDKNVYELYRKGSKVVHRQVWKGSQIASGSFASEARAALDLARLAKAASKAKDAKKETGTTKVGEVECVAIKVSLPSDIADSDDDSAEGAGGFTFKMFELKKVETTFYFGKDDNLLRKAEFKFVKGFNAQIAMAMPGGGGGEEDEDDEDDGGKGGVKSSFATTTKLTLGAFSKTASVSVPDDVKGLLQE